MPAFFMFCIKNECIAFIQIQLLRLPINYLAFNLQATDICMHSIIKQHLHPKYWPTWMGLGLMCLCGQLPMKLYVPIGRSLGPLLLKLSARRASIARINLNLCFPDKTESEIDRMIDELFKEMGVGLFELCVSWFAPIKKLRKLADIDGQQYLIDALKQGNGAIMMTGHFLNIEIGSTLLATQFPTCATYREHKNSLFEAVMTHSRYRLTYERERLNSYPIIKRTDIRGMIKALKANFPVLYFPDQDYGTQKAVFVPFFGIPAATLTATSRIAKVSKAKVIPFFFKRKLDNSGYSITLMPTLDSFPSDNLEHDTSRIMKIIEAEITDRPTEYLWLHRRFKNRPEGRADFYPPPKSKRGKAREAEISGK